MDILVSLGGPVVHSWIRALLDRAAVDVVAKEQPLRWNEVQHCGLPSDSYCFHKQSGLCKLCLAVPIVICFINLAGHEATNGFRAVLAQEQSWLPARGFLA